MAGFALELDFNSLLFLFAGGAAIRWGLLSKIHGKDHYDECNKPNEPLRTNSKISNI